MAGTNIKGLPGYVKKFELGIYAYPYTPTFLQNCSGGAIEKINECLTKFDQIGSGIDRLYSGSGIYFQVVADNYERAEISNTLIEAVREHSNSNS